METLLIKSKLSDEDLVRKIVVNNNTKLFAVLYDRFSQTIFNKCYRFSNCREEAEDLTHDVFVHLYVKLKQFKGKSKFSTWLYSFTYNFCVNYTQRNSYKKQERITVKNDNIADIGFCEEADDSNIVVLKTKKLLKALDLIESSEKMILLMKYQDGMSIIEIKDFLNIGESAVKMRIKRAKAKLIEVYNKL
ncbi:sigma-70 family RNA polymerase sigma factor [Polaribacter sp.]|nr:sigma-70 family RNA polymerase sigma factor [Polaribacter sp.]